MAGAATLVNGRVFLAILSGQPAGIPAQPGLGVIEDQQIKDLFSHLGKLVN